MNKQKILKSGWNTINWLKTNEIVFKLQQEIYTASKEGDLRKIRRFQHKLLESAAARFAAVKKITQDNQVNADIDGVKALNLVCFAPIELAFSLKIPTNVSVLRKVWIPKNALETCKKKPLDISTIKNLCLQFLLKLALEPEWEARFEANSYGFRPGRKSHDAIKSILNTVIKNKKYVFDADITPCLDRIDHNAILQKLNLKGSLAKPIKYWLKNGILDGETFMDTSKKKEKIISSLLLNIALHGLEIHLKEWIASSCEILDNRTGHKLAPEFLKKSIHIVRYAANFVIFHKDKEIILKCKAEVEKFLVGIGLDLSTAKTRLTHTLELKEKDILAEGFDDIVGFNFLGFTIKQFKTRHRSTITTTGKILGFKTLIVPSKKSVNNHQKNLHDFILRRGKKLTQVVLIKKLNPIIRSWASYFGISDAGTTGHLTKVDYWTYLKLRRWAKRMKGGSKAGSKYWKRIGNQKWIFCSGKITLLKHVDYSYPISRYIKVLGKASIFDKNLSLYWSKRIKNFPNFNKQIS